MARCVGASSSAFAREGIVKEDMEDAFGDACPLSEDLLVLIVASLPFKALFRLRVVSKWWNAIVKDPRFRQARPSFCQEFASQAMAYTLARYRDAEVDMAGCVGGYVLLHGESWDFGYTHHDIYVLHPAELYFRQLPQVVWSLPPERMQLIVRGIALDEKTKEYSVFVCSWEHSAYISCKFGPFGLVTGVRNDRRLRRELRYFNSGTNLWTSCGRDGLSYESIERRLEEIAIYQDRHTILFSGLGNPKSIYTVLSYNEAGSWDMLPGEFPFSGYPKPFAFFENRGQLYIGAVTGPGTEEGSSCDFWMHNLWVYRDDAMDWVSVFSHRFECRGEEVNWYETFVQRSGDFFHFGVFASDPSSTEIPQNYDTDGSATPDTDDTDGAPEVENALVPAAQVTEFIIDEVFRQRMVYNVVTGELEDFSGELDRGTRKRHGVMVMKDSAKALICLD